MNNVSIAIIPARGGSKRIPKKNIKNFLGKPIIAYSIEAAIKSKLFDEIIVSTDDNEIAKIALAYGAKVPFMRSEKNADDYATTMDVIFEVLNTYKEYKNLSFKYVCCIYPTVPLIQIKDLKEGIEKIKQNNYSIVYPIVDFGYSIWRGLRIENSGKTKMIWPEFENSRTQDLEKVYHDAGQWYWFNTEKINDLNNIGSIILSEENVQDIDTLIDWKLAEMKYKLIHNV